MFRPLRWLPLLVGAAVLLPAAPALAANCTDFASQLAAQDFYNAQQGDPDGLDSDGDGWACESNPAPKASAPKGASAPPPPPPTPVPTPTPTPEPVAKATKTTARVLSVVDGDTIKVRTANGRPITVRLIGVDTPETGKPGTPVECGGKQATAAMKKLVLRKRGRRTVGRAVRLTSDPSQDATDRYGRTLAYVNVVGGVDVGRSMVKAGWAAVYVFESPFVRLATFTAAQDAAKAAGRGVWDACGGDFHRAA